MKKSSFHALHRIAIMAAFFFFGTVASQAQSFTGEAGDQLWSNPGNWLDGIKPTEESENVRIGADVIVDEDVTIVSLFDASPCDLTIQSGKRLAVGGSFTWSLGGEIILEDGAQLVHQEAQLHAKVLKKIAAYDENSSLWNLIASPVLEDVTPSLENGFLTVPETGYSLYTFDEEHQEWINFTETPFVLKNGLSYLYANALDTTLVFEGNVRSSAAPVEINLSYHATTSILSGCNLVGNPFTCNAFVDRSYYVLNDNSNSLVPVALSTHTPLAPCAGAIVMTKEEGQTVKISHEAPISSENQGYIEISVAKSNEPDKVQDQALLSFNEGDELDKFVLDSEAPMVYFTKGSRELGILSIDSTNAQPMRFKALTDGYYTLHFEIKESSLSYLHLIDNITGSNVDLLTTPNYSFSATHNDYASRFQLVFDPHFGVEEIENVPFAYISNGRIYINDVETCHGASLQIVDMMGRTAFCGDVSGNVSTEGMSPGIYVLRLNDGNTVRTQKMVIE